MPAPFKPPPTGSLPKKGKRMHAKVYESARERGFSKERSAQQAWGAVRNAGYYQDASGRWHSPGNPHRKGKKMAKRKTKTKKTALARAKAFAKARRVKIGKSAAVPGGPKRRKKREPEVIAVAGRAVKVT